MVSGRRLGAEKPDVSPPHAEHQPLTTFGFLQEATREERVDRGYAPFLLAHEPFDPASCGMQRQGGRHDRVCTIHQLSRTRCSCRDALSAWHRHRRLIRPRTGSCSLRSWGQGSHRYLCGGQGGGEGLGGGLQGAATVTVTVTVGPGTVVVCAGPATVVVSAGPATVVVLGVPGTVVVTVGPGTGTVSVLPGTVVVTAGAGTVVVVVEPATVTKLVVAVAGNVLPGPVRVTVSPSTVSVRRGVVWVTMRVSPVIVRTCVLQTTS